MRIIANAMVYATAAGALAFILAYRRLAPWRSTPIGRNVMAFMTVILIVTSLAIVTITFGVDLPGRQTIRALSWGSIAGIIWWRVVLVVRAQQLPARHEQRPVLAGPGQVASDARNRAVRTFLQGLATDVIVSVTVALMTVVTDLVWTRAYWIAVASLVGKSVAVAIVSYLARIFVPPKP